MANDLPILFTASQAGRIVETVKAFETGDLTNQPKRRRTGVSYPSPFMPCMVELSGGSAGDASTQCSFTYDVTNYRGDLLLEDATPLKPRPALGAMVAPSAETNYGQIFIDETRTLQLWDAGEVIDTAPC